MILLTPEGHLGRIVLVNKGQWISHAERWVCGKGHVSAVITYDCADGPMHGSEDCHSTFIRELAYLMSFVMVWICPTGPMHRRTISPMLAFSSAVPSALGFKRIKMAVVRL